MSKMHKQTAPAIVAKKHLNKATDSLDGLPTCRYCLRPFARWETLKRHLQQGHCVRLAECGTDIAQQSPLDVQEAGAKSLPSGQKHVIAFDGLHESQQDGNNESANMQTTRQQKQDHLQHSLPYAERPDVQQAISLERANGVYKLGDRMHLKQTCAICGQWIASSHMVKIHYKKSHPKIHEQHGTAAAAFCRHFS